MSRHKRCYCVLSCYRLLTIFQHFLNILERSVTFFTSNIYARYLNDYSLIVKLQDMMFIIVLKRESRENDDMPSLSSRLDNTSDTMCRYCLIKIMSDKFSPVCSARFIRWLIKCHMSGLRMIRTNDRTFPNNAQMQLYN